MPSIDFQATGFPEKILNVSRPIDAVTWGDIFKAAITVGHRDDAALRQYGTRSWFEALSRFFRIKMSLAEGDIAQIKPTDLFQEMDPSEKGVVSYYLGLTFCKLYADRHLRTPWLMHHDVYRKYLGSSLSGVRPDLVGLSLDNRWITFEAKGRRRGPSPKAQVRAKNQANGLPTVQGTPISMSVVSWTCIYKNYLRVLWKDPPAKQGDKEDSLNLTPEKMLEHYYGPLLTLETVTNIQRQKANQSFALPFSDLGLTVEIDPKLSGLLRKDDYAHAYRYLCDQGRVSAGPQNMSDFGLDGVRVHVG